MPKAAGTPASRKAKHGEKMIQITLSFWTNNIADGKDQIVPKHAWTSGVVRVEPNKTHEIEASQPKPFHTLLDLTSVIEKALIDHGITLHASKKTAKYITA